MKRRDGADGRLRAGGWLPESELDLAPSGRREVEPVTELIPVTDEKPWDVAGMEKALNEGVDEGDAYKGRRRLRSASFKGRVAIVAAAVGVAGVAVAVPLLSAPAPAEQDQTIGLPFPTDGVTPDPIPNPALTAPPQAPTPEATTVATVPTRAATTPPGQSPAPGLPAVTTAPGRVPAPGPAPGPGVAPTTPVVTAPTTAPVSFVPIEMEAEEARRGGSAEVDNPSCADDVEVVRQIGNWGFGTPGTLTFDVTVPTSGTYALTFRSVVSDAGNRTAEIRVNGGPPVLATVSQGCLVVNTVVLTLTAGDNDIQFANATARAPSIDKIALRAA